MKLDINYKRIIGQLSIINHIDSKPLSGGLTPWAFKIGGSIDIMLSGSIRNIVDEKNKECPVRPKARI